MNKRINILIVEDEVIVAMDIEQRLVALGYNVLGVIDNGEEVLAYLTSGKTTPDLLLLDINLKGEASGIEISDKVKSLYKIPVVFLTANSNLGTIEKAQKTDPYGFVFKPFNSTDLRVAIEIAENKFTYEKQLEIVNSELEARVAKRTEDLQKLNEHLKQEIEIRNQVEKELIASKSLFENTVSNLGSGLALVDSKGNIISANYSLLSIVGETEVLLKSKKISDLIGEKAWKRIIVFLNKGDSDIWNSEYLISTTALNKYCNFYVTKVSQKSNSEFIISVIDIDEAKRNRALLVEERKKRMLSLFEGEERERKRISKDLHDNLGQKLTAAKLSIGSVLMDEALDSKYIEVLSDSKEIIEESMQDIREMSQNLFPSVLSDFGLESAIEKIIERINKTGKTKCKLSVEGNIKDLDHVIELNLFRICQEAISNAVRYSGATRVSIKIFNTKEVLSIRITDNGKGMNLEEVTLGSGLNNMEERASAIHAEFFLESKNDKGTEIIVRLAHGKKN